MQQYQPRYEPQYQLYQPRAIPQTHYQSPMSRFPQPTNARMFLNAGIYMIIVGAILCGLGVIVISFFQDKIIIKPDLGSYSPTQFSFAMEIPMLQIGLILIGISIMLQGIGSALTIKAHFEK